MRGREICTPGSDNMGLVDDATAEDGITVEEVAIVADIEQLGERPTGVLVLPLRLQDGKAVYSESSVMLVKELRSLGAEAKFLHTSGERTFEVRKSAVALVVAYVIGIASNASWDAMKTLLRKRADRRISVTYVELEHGRGQRGTAWKAEGDSEGVIQAIDRLRQPPENPPRADDGD
jgi:hypothetical protein